jgi:hypothetical protein
MDNGVDMPIEMDLLVEGTDGGGEMRALTISRSFAPSGGTSRQTAVVLDEHDPELLAFMNNAPETLSWSGTMRVGDGASRGSARRGDVIGGEVSLAAPMEVVILPSRIPTDVSDLSIDSDVRDTIRDNVASARLVASFVNHVPSAATIHLVVSSEAARAGDIDDPSNLVFSEELPGPRIGPDGGGRGDGGWRLRPRQGRTRIFEQAPVFVSTVIDLAGSEGPVRFHGHRLPATNAYLVATARVEP